MSEIQDVEKHRMLYGPGKKKKKKNSPADIRAARNLCNTLLSLNNHGGVCVSTLEAKRATEQDNSFSYRLGSAIL